ncbi:60S ribosomal protein L22, putative [Entamoeba invadens IP1]|uniref:60S ribosomal protein L22, putative n=1 Tax=Entamoeba invadens IP1 TaxID=370355 RepID=UPI0002C3E86E|nr:60S ribosomal protein L22, putative [Entamoeba invadens IP1]XP_004184766.1 60S ribosomal protein L22, putative [Entamoeba invadens IP1]ELP85396.1 60S ribosomal protein L22, putative [Entamoeba invadens IP1]ELP85420.1 60S ribosomal protein L22, putative [Entamoeba invadens IP1]|eukprot:XP_004184742.1 60S ribosomal protein L22, putative [Entamoeba invadens IP1]
MSKAVKAPASEKVVVDKKKVTKDEEATTFTCFFDLTSCTDFIEPKKLVTYFKQTIKMSGKAGNTKGISVTIVDGKKVTITTQKEGLCKKYMKYLMKKYLKKNNLREWLRVVSDKNEGFVLKFYNVQNDEEEEKEEPTAQAEDKQ